METSAHARYSMRQQQTCTQSSNFMVESTAGERFSQKRLLHAFTEGPATKAYRLVEQQHSASWKVGYQPQHLQAAGVASSADKNSTTSASAFSYLAQQQSSDHSRGPHASAAALSMGALGAAKEGACQGPGTQSVTWPPQMSLGIGTQYQLYTNEKAPAAHFFCVRCGGAGHSWRECPSDPERVAQVCLFCRDSHHSTKDCERAKSCGWVLGRPIVDFGKLQVRDHDVVTRVAQPPQQPVAAMRRCKVALMRLADEFKLMRDPREDFSLAEKETDPSQEREVSSSESWSGRSVLTRRSVVDDSSPPRKISEKNTNLNSPQCGSTLRLGVESSIESEYQAMVARGGVSKELRGINIPWPYSRFILNRIKTIDARRYALGSYRKELLWLIETPGKADDRLPSSTRPVKARIVGTIIFSGDKKYESEEMLRADADAHQIPIEDGDRRAKSKASSNMSMTPKRVRSGICGWDSSCDQYAWYISHVRALKYAVAGPATKGIRGSRKCQRCVIFTDHTPCSESL